MTHPRLGAALTVVMAAGLSVCACASAGPSQASGGSGEPHPVLARMTADRPAPATDTIEVWVCDVPPDTTAPRYGRLPLRQPLTPEGLVDAIGDRVAAYFATVSDLAYQVRFRAGGTVALAAADDEEDCVEAALDRSSPEADAVLAVATAEHVEGSSGGWGRPGTWASCSGPCPASATRRAAYVGASDFHPDWGEVPLLDLVEHELGHTLGLPHSGTPRSGSDVYPSALDLMSDSAAPRAVDPARRDGPPPIGIARLDLGWLDASDVEQVSAASPAPVEVRLVPSTDPRGTRLLVLPALPVDEHRVLTVEFLVPSGYLDHLPEAGVAVHVVDDRAGGGLLRVHDTVGVAPFTDLLGEGESIRVEGWEIRVGGISPGSAAGDDSTTGAYVDLAATPIAR